MSVKIDTSIGVIHKGIDGHVHYEIVTRDEFKHQIGRCSCGRIVDYTLMQRQIIELTSEKFNKDFNMDHYMRDLKGDVAVKRRKVKTRMVNQ
jgi:hypothetical protein